MRVWLSLTAFVVGRVTLIDVLAQNPEFQELIRHLQRFRLIIPLNQLTNTTFFAPNNRAFERYYEAQNVGGSESAMTADRLWYHLVRDRRLPLANLTAGLLLETLFIPDQGLGGRGGQRVKIVEDGGQPTLRPFHREDDGDETPAANVLVNHRARVVNGDFTADNGIIHMVDRVLDFPARLLNEVARRDELATADVWIGHCLAVRDRLINDTGFTLLAPGGNSLVHHFNVWERRYLFHSYGGADLHLLLDAHLVPAVVYSQDLLPTTTPSRNDTANATPGDAMATTYRRRVTTLAGHTVELGWKPQAAQFTVNGVTATAYDQLADNGVLHVLPAVLSPPDLVFTAEKYLIGLNMTQFVDLLRAAGLADLLQAPGGGADDHSSDHRQAITILAPTNEALDAFRESDDLPAEGSAQLREFLRYHLVHGQYHRADLADNQFLASHLQPVLLGKDRPQLIRVTKHIDAIAASNGGDGDEKGYLAFNDVITAAAPVTLGRVTIYPLTYPLSPPADLLQVVIRDLRYSTFLSLLFTSQLKDRLAGATDVTYLVPSNAAFEDLGLALDYLLLPEASGDLRQLVKSLVARRATYAHRLDRSADGGDGKPGRGVCLETLAGTNVSLVVLPDGDTAARIDECIGGNRPDHDSESGLAEKPLRPLNVARVAQSDILVRNGVVQLIDRAVVPQAINLTLHSLLRGAGATVFLGWLRRLNLTDLLHEPIDATHGGYTIFLPTDQAFARLNLTQGVNSRGEGYAEKQNSAAEEEESDPNHGDLKVADIRALISQHIVPNRRVVHLGDRARFGTLLGRDHPANGPAELVIREYSPGRFGVRIQGGFLFDRHYATVVRRGVATNGAVYQIDGILVPLVARQSNGVIRAQLRHALWLLCLGIMALALVYILVVPIYAWYHRHVAPAAAGGGIGGGGLAALAAGLAGEDGYHPVATQEPDTDDDESEEEEDTLEGRSSRDGPTSTDTPAQHV
ncbi:hypothetical protein IWQ60_005122 [Tieghemiomyces parasiticus]|uniref:FAS1 domain-containing protein n=1 Tax=Tieghemiomyces parasiticus TaxID=78921 RepID=A0A9W8AEN4_9FUNG|nr:hypothetical protein IWQ60_005122 [Tieghemiomyces parasiticus]